MPWTLGLVEAIDAVDLIERSNLGTKNRIASILLDSNFSAKVKSRPKLTSRISAPLN